MAVAAIVGVYAYLGPFSLDPDDVERDVGARFEQQEGVAVDLRCPRDMPVESGGFFECRGQTADGRDVVISIRIADPQDDADYFWSIDPG